MTRDEVIDRITDELIRSRHINYKGVVSKVLSFLQPGDEVGEGLVVATELERKLGQIAIDEMQKSGELT